MIHASKFIYYELIKKRKTINSLTRSVLPLHCHKDRKSKYPRLKIFLFFSTDFFMSDPLLYVLCLHFISRNMDQGKIPL